MAADCGSDTVRNGHGQQSGINGESGLSDFLCQKRWEDWTAQRSSGRAAYHCKALTQPTTHETG